MALRDIRRRIKSVKNTAQITKAMQLVASSKMRRAQQQALAGKPYTRLLNEVIGSLRDHVDLTAHPFLQPREAGRHLVIVVSTNKGLCGALNTNLSRVAHGLPTETAFVSMGKKGTQFLARTKRDLLADFELHDKITFADARKMTQFAIDRYRSGDVAKISVLYSEFINTLTQRATLRQILPIVKLEAVQAGLEDKDHTEVLTGGANEYLFEPNPQDLLNYALERFVEFSVYQMVLEANASEHSARMVAMKSATDNAKQLVKDLTLVYNRERQAGITKEILEIATAQAAMS